MAMDEIYLMDSLCMATLIYVLEPGIFCFVIMLRNGQEMCFDLHLCVTWFLITHSNIFQWHSPSHTCAWAGANDSLIDW